MRRHPTSKTFKGSVFIEFKSAEEMNKVRRKDRVKEGRGHRGPPDGRGEVTGVLLMGGERSQGSS